MNDLLKMIQTRKIYLLLFCALALPVYLHAQASVDTTLPVTEEPLIVDENALLPDTAIDMPVPVAEDAETGENSWEDLLRKDSAHALMDNEEPFAETDAPKFLAPRTTDGDILKEIKAQKAFRYEEEAQKKVRRIDTNSGWYKSMAWVRANMNVFFWTFLALLVLILALGIAQFVEGGNFAFFRRTKPTGEWAASHEAEMADEHLDYETRARNAIAAGNFRQAVRFLYLHSLEVLQGKQLIVPGVDKTNADYLRDLRNTRWHQPFSMLTLAYEYVWYGEVNISHQQFDELYGRFTAFKNDLR